MKTPHNAEAEMLLYPEGVLLVLCLTDPHRVPHPAVRDRLVEFQIQLNLAVHRRRRLGDIRRFGEIATELCNVTLVERAMADAAASPVEGDAFMCRVLDEQLAHLG